MNPQPKEKRWRSKAYLKWLEKQVPIMGGTGDTIYHHIKMFGGGGMRIKPPDDHCIPIPSSVHEYIHQHGEKSVLFGTYGYTKEHLRSICREYRKLWESQK